MHCYIVTLLHCYIVTLLHCYKHTLSCVIFIVIVLFKYLNSTTLKIVLKIIPTTGSGGRLVSISVLYLWTLGFKFMY